jgi:hypothetical protein
MSPEIAERLARVFPAPIQKSAVAAVAPVADATRYRRKPMELQLLAPERGNLRKTAGTPVATVARDSRKPPELQPLQPRQVENGKTGKTREGAAGEAPPLVSDWDAIEERAGLAADSVPACYLDAWARLNHQKPFDVSGDEWRLALDDGGRFLDAFGAEAEKSRWTPGDLFDVRAGLVWQLIGERVEALCADHVRLDDERTIARGTR